MDYLECFEVPRKESMVHLLRRSLYGLKQSTRCWYMMFDKYVQRIWLQRSACDPYVCCKDQESDEVFYLLFYLDDILVGNKERNKLKQLKELLNNEIEMKDLGVARRILRMKIFRE